MKHFCISFEVPADKLSTVVSLLSGECSNLSVSEVKRQPRVPGAPVRPGQEKNADWAKPTIDKMVASMKKDAVYKSSHFEPAVAAGGYSSSSLSGILSHAVALGRIARAGTKGKYTYRLPS